MFVNDSDPSGSSVNNTQDTEDGQGSIPQNKWKFKIKRPSGALNKLDAPDGNHVNEDGLQKEGFGLDQPSFGLDEVILLEKDAQTAGHLLFNERSVLIF